MEDWSNEIHRTTGHYPSSKGEINLTYSAEIAGTSTEGIDLAEGFSKVSNEVIEAKLKALQNGDILYVYKGCQWFTKNNDLKIVEEIVKDTLEYPE